MTDPNRRIDDRLPTEPLDWEDPEVKHARESTRLANAMAEAGAAFLAHMDVGGVIAQIPNTDQYVVAGTLAMIAKVLPADAPIPPLTAPAPLTDELRKLVNAHCNDLLDCAAILHDDGRFERTAEEIRTAVAELRAAMRAAPAPQQSELTDERIEELARTYDVESREIPIEFIVNFARAIEREVAKAAPAAPVQTAEQIRNQALEEGLEMAARHLDKQRQAVDQDHAYQEPDTGAWVFDRPETEEYSNTLAELADEIRALRTPSTGEASKGGDHE
jgi:hypothetical protein